MTPVPAAAARNSSTATGAKLGLFRAIRKGKLHYRFVRAGHNPALFRAAHTLRSTCYKEYVSSDLTLRTTFDREAARYGRARPAPPEPLLNAVLQRLQPGAHVLEVGCGTGQATLPLARAGLRVRALELGTALAELARTNLSQYPNVTVQTVAFEDFRSNMLFDALVSVQAFHWIAPEAGLAHAASLLRPGGALLLAWHRERSQDTAFYRATDPIHKRFENPLELRRPVPDFAPDQFSSALATSPYFGSLSLSRFPWSYRYSKTRYLDLLLTYSNVQALEAEAREHFLSEIAEIIDAHGGEVERFYESVLLSAYRRE